MGLDPYIDKQTGELSTGTRRITELTCVIALEPTLILLDEPSSGVAQRETEQLGELLAKVKAHLGATLIVIEHDMPLIMGISDRIIAMDSGKVIAEGTPAEVIANAARPRVLPGWQHPRGRAVRQCGRSRPARSRRRSSAAKKPSKVTEAGRAAHLQGDDRRGQPLSAQRGAQGPVHPARGRPGRCPVTLAVERLRCEHLPSPAVVDRARPRLSWQVTSTRRGAKQSCVPAVGRERRLSCCGQGIGDVWDSGRVESPECVLVPYGGRELTSRELLHWTVRVWDELGEASAFAPPASWEMGLLQPADWQAQWIAAPEHEPSQVHYLRSSAATGCSPTRARAYVTALGSYELQCNGVRVGDQRFSPGWTDYSQRHPLPGARPHRAADRRRQRAHGSARRRLVRRLHRLPGRPRPLRRHPAAAGPGRGRRGRACTPRGRAGRPALARSAAATCCRASTRISCVDSNAAGRSCVHPGQRCGPARSRQHRPSGSCARCRLSPWSARGRRRTASISARTSSAGCGCACAPSRHHGHRPARRDPAAGRLALRRQPAHRDGHRQLRARRPRLGRTALHLPRLPLRRGDRPPR